MRAKAWSAMRRYVDRRIAAVGTKAAQHEHIEAPPMILIRLWTWFRPSLKAFVVKPSAQRYGQ
jgi:hypothetical protein